MVSFSCCPVVGVLVVETFSESVVSGRVDTTLGSSNVDVAVEVLGSPRND